LQGKTHLNAAFISGHESCVLPISVGWDSHEDGFIESTLEMVDRKFNSCRIVVCDTLQVHTLKHTKSELAPKYLSYEEYAYDLGSEWIKRYSHLIERMNINVHLTRWGEYTAAPQYQDLKNEIQTLIKKQRMSSNTFLLQQPKLHMMGLKNLVDFQMCPLKK
jgi:hypothetical protein